jgi:SAM-dependent methyltransferase/glycosyltransferase involved in cell wall biosynthesis
MENYSKYARVVKPGDEESLSKIAAKVSINSMVLDVGCSVGMLGRYLSLEKGCIVDGVDIDDQALQQCKQVYRKIACKNLEHDDLTDVFVQESYDFIVVADIVEHLVDPDRLFSQLKLLVKPHGSIIFSVPNIMHVAVALELLLGNFDYKQSGLLDSTHIRFYTYQSIVARLVNSGLYVWGIDTVRKEIEETEFGGLQNKLFPRNWLDALIDCRPDALVYQWIISTRIYPQLDHIEEPTAAKRAKKKPLFTAELYWDDERKAGFNESQKIVGFQTDESGDELRVSFCFQHMDQTNISQIRIDPISERKPLWIKRATVSNELNQIIWEWIPENQTDNIFNAEWINTPAKTVRILFPTNEDPQWFPKISAEVLQKIKQGAEFTIVMVEDRDVIDSIIVSALYAADSFHSIREEQNANLNQIVSERDGQIANLNQSVAERDEQIASINQSVAERNRHISSLNQSVLDRDGQISALVAERDQIFNSTSWRLTRPVRAIGKQLKRLRRIMKIVLSATKHGGGIKLAIGKAVQIYQKEGMAGLRKLLLELGTPRPTQPIDSTQTSNEEANSNPEIPQIDFDQTRNRFVEYQKNAPINPLVKLIAFYLPQFHPFPENDEWWGKGFTEWTNVGKALPNYFGHYQPHCPIHHGYYDLRVPEVMEEQAKLAKEYGIYGFSYYFYWFGGKVLMDTPLKLMLANKKVDIPFCLTWANENWSRRWDGMENDILIAQNHSDEDSLAFIRHLVKYFKDERYIRIDGKPVLIIYRANIIPNMAATAKIWRDEMLKYDIPGLYLVSVQVFGVDSPKEFDFDASVEFSPLNAPGADISHELEIVNPEFRGHIYSYERLVAKAKSIEEPDYKLFRTAILSWDNTARRQNNSQLFHGFSLRFYKQWLSWIVNKVCANPKYMADEKIVFVNAWNEWAEGTHLEPDQEFGYGYLQTTYDVLRHSEDLSHQIVGVTSPRLRHSGSSTDHIASSDAVGRNELGNDMSLSSSGQIAHPHKVSRLRQRIMLLIRLYQNYRQSYPGLGGLWRLSRTCVDVVRSGGAKGFRNKISSYEHSINKPPVASDAEAPQGNALQIDLLRQYLENELISNPTIIFDHNLGGGANTYSRELSKAALTEGGTVLRVYNFECSVWYVQWMTAGDSMLFYAPSVEELFRVLSISHGRRIIVNSLYGFPDMKKIIELIVELAQALDAALDYKVHDFISHCPSPHLSDFNGDYCGVPQDSEVCKLCLKENLIWYPDGYPKENQPADISEWRRPFARLFEAATTVTLFDPSSIEIFRQVFHLEDRKIKIVPHVDDYFNCDKQLDLGGHMHVGVLGTLTNIKGVQIVQALSDYIDRCGLQIPIIVVGACYVTMPSHIKVHGSYEQNQLPAIIENYGINVILAPSIVPETFGYTISEAMKMRLPIVAFDIGAQGSRVKKYELGKVVPLGSSPEVILAAVQSALKIVQESKK